MTLPRRVRLAALGLLFAAPPAATLAFILTFGVNAAYWDHLFDAEVFRRFHDGGLTPAFLFSPHNEHRRAVHRLVVLALGSMTRWNNVAELVLDWALLIGVAAVLYRTFPADRRRLWFAPVLVMLFSLRQHQAFLLADCVSAFLCLTLTVVTLAALAETARTWTIPVATATAVLATFSHANGLLLWPIGAVLLVAGRKRRAEVVSWIAIGTIVTALYLSGLPNLAGDIDPLQVTRYFVVEVGGALTGRLWPASVAGAAILGMVAAAMTLGISDRHATGLWLMVFGVAAAMLVAYGRSKFGVTQALESRYAVFSGLIVIGLYQTALAHDGRRARRLRIASVAMIVASIVPATAEGLRAGRTARNDRRWNAYVLYTAKYQSDDTLAGLFPHPTEARQHAATLERLGLNVFADSRSRFESLARTNGSALFWIDRINGAPIPPDRIVRVGANETITIAGWAADPAAHQAAPALFAVIDATIRIPAFCGLERPDVVRVVGTGGARSGFVLTFSSDVLTPGVHALALEVVAADGLRVFSPASIAHITRQ